MRRLAGRQRDGTRSAPADQHRRCLADAWRQRHTKPRSIARGLLCADRGRTEDAEQSHADRSCQTRLAVEAYRSHTEQPQSISERLFVRGATITVAQGRGCQLRQRSRRPSRPSQTSSRLAVNSSRGCNEALRWSRPSPPTPATSRSPRSPPAPNSRERSRLGLDTFGDITAGPDGRPQSHAQVIREVIEQGVLADQVGVDVIGLGEHHRPDFAVSTPDIVLAAIAGRTTRIRLGSSVTVLGSDDPVRVFQRFSTLDAASNGRAEVILGRGSFAESFPLFGYDLSQRAALFADKLDLFAALITQEQVTWRGTTRSALINERVYPPIETGRLEDVDRRGRQSGIGGARCALWAAPDACDHRRRRPALSAVRRPLSPGPGAAGPTHAADRGPFARVMWRRATNARATSCGRTTRRCGTASAPSAAGPR